MSLLQYLFSPVCLHCGSFFVEESLLCDACFNQRLRPRIRLKNASSISGHHYLVAWPRGESNLLSQMVYRLKDGRSAAALSFYVQMLYEKLKNEISWSQYRAIVPIAGSRATSIHARLLAEELSALCGLPVWDLLQKSSAFEQKKLSLSERRQRMKVTVKAPLPEHFTKLIFVDDILTTGSSFKQSRIALNANEENLILTLFYRPRS